MADKTAFIKDAESEQFKQFCREVWNDRVLFARKVVGISRLDQQQIDVLSDLDKHDHVANKAGHGTGKTTVEGLAILHYLCTRPDCKIPCTAPSKHQLYDVLWAELSKWLNSMKKTPMGAIFANNIEWKKETVVNILNPAEWFAAARTATKDNVDSLQGFHANYILRVIEEGSGVSDTAYETLDGAYGTMETKSLTCGNPVRREGQFYRIFNEEKGFFKCRTSSCLTSTIADKRYVARMIQKYGEDSNIVRIRVKGEFPLSDSESYIPYAWCEAARFRDIAPQNMYRKIFGVDVARGGADRTVLAVRQGDKFMPYHILRTNDTMKIVRFVAGMADKEKPEAIFVDVIGVGAGVFDRLRELGYPAIAVNSSETISMEFPERYKRLRDELWGKMRDWLETGRGQLWDNEDGDLIGELSSPHFKIMEAGKIKVESKDEMKARLPGVGSPDIADAHIMAFAMPISNYNSDLTEDSESDYNDRFQPLDSKAGY